MTRRRPRTGPNLIGGGGPGDQYDQPADNPRELAALIKREGQHFPPPEVFESVDDHDTYGPWAD